METVETFLFDVSEEDFNSDSKFLGDVCYVLYSIQENPQQYSSLLVFVIS